MSREEFKRLYPKSETAQTAFSPVGGFQAPAWLQGDNCVVAEYWQVETETRQLWMYRGIPQADDEDGDESASAPRGSAPRSAPPAAPVNAPPLAPAASAPLNGAPGVPAAPRAYDADDEWDTDDDTPLDSEFRTAPQGNFFPRAYDADEDGYVLRGYFDDEDVPEGFEPDLDDEGERVGREVEVRSVWRYDLNGHEILGPPKPWAGKYIPIVPSLGKEKYVEGERFLFSAVRFALDPQQLYNFYKTTEAEVIQLTPKNPYIGALGQFKTMQLTWADMNRVPRPYVEYDPVMVGGQLAPAPQRQPYEPATQALVVGAGAANEDIKATTGLFDPSRGQATPNADSGVAIAQLQQQGETATYHFFDNFLRSMWHGYRILLDLIPKIYDTPRVVRIVRPDDEVELVQINRMFSDKAGKRVKYDLQQGLYAVALSVQPSQATRRQQAAADLAGLAKADPQSLPQWADLFVKQLDIGPLGDEIADRLTPPQYRQQDGQDPQKIQQAAQMLSAQNQQLTAQVHALAQQLETKQYDAQQKDAANQRDNETKAAIAMMQEQTKRNSDAIRLAIAEISAKAQTQARAFSDILAVRTEQEAMAHERGMQAYQAAIAAHNADAGIPAGGMDAGAMPQGDESEAPPQAAQPQGAPGAQRVPNDADLMQLMNSGGAPQPGQPPTTPPGGQLPQGTPSPGNP
jgi:hypothetical protein